MRPPAALAAPTNPDESLVTTAPESPTGMEGRSTPRGRAFHLFFGPPGSGKTLLAQRLPTILPPFARGEALESSLVHSVAGLLPRGMGLLTARPFRAPHHTITAAGLVGGGAIPRPGEVSLAHGGVLFVDEMPELRPPGLNLLRQPVEDGVVRVVRARRTVEFP